MEVIFAPDLQVDLNQLAARTGRNTDELVHDAIRRYVDDETLLLEGVERGIAAADSGEFIEEIDMDARVEQMLRT